MVISFIIPLMLKNTLVYAGVFFLHSNFSFFSKQKKRGGIYYEEKGE
jgi:hypothetical protein